MSIFKLPPEILTLICKELQPIDAIQIARACRVFFAIIRPILYRTIDLHNGSLVPLAGNWIILTRTIQKNPNLGRLCHKLAFEVDEEEMMKEKFFEPAQALLSRLPHLRAIEVRNGLGLRAMWSMILLYAARSGLQSLRLIGRRCLPSLAVIEAQTPIQDLALHIRNPQTKLIGQILSRALALRQFVFYGDALRCHWSFLSLQEVLRGSRATLQEIAIGQLPDGGALLQASTFPNLQALQLSILNLMESAPKDAARALISPQLSLAIDICNLGSRSTEGQDWISCFQIHAILKKVDVINTQSDKMVHSAVLWAGSC